LKLGDVRRDLHPSLTLLDFFSIGNLPPHFANYVIPISSVATATAKFSSSALKLAESWLSFFGGFITFFAF
jgi:hypothetical protein